MARITRDNVDHYLNLLNENLAAENKPYRYEITAQNGGYGLDKYKGDVCVDYCIAGLKLRELYDIVRFAANVQADNLLA